jgi:hypothetical protein
MEVLALRHQLQVLQRSGYTAREFQDYNGSRTFFANLLLGFADMVSRSIAGVNPPRG